MFNYVYMAVAVAFLSLVGLSKYQWDRIEDLKQDKAVWENKNEELSKRIEDQNLRLKEGEEKYNKVQQDLNVAKGINSALGAEYKKLRDEWKNQPLPKDCASAMVELKSRSSILAKKWNTK